MTPTQIDAAAATLLDARRRGVQLSPPPGPAPADRDTVYAIQDAVARALGPVEGWKTGAPSPEAEPNCAPLVAGSVVAGPATFAARSMHMIGVEAEIAFRLGRDLPAAATPPSDTEIVGAIASAHVVVEVVDTRWADYKKLDPLWHLADNQLDLALVVGPSFEDWLTHAYDRQPVQLIVDGKPLVDKIGGLACGSPLRVLRWLIRHAVTRRGGLRAGAMITTGSWVGLQFVHPGADVVARFPGFGETRVTFPK